MGALIAVAALLALAASSGGKSSGGKSTFDPYTPGGLQDPYPVTHRPGDGTAPDAIAVGYRNDPDIAPLLAEMEQMIVAAGIPKRGWTAYDLTAHKGASGPADDKPLSIPPRGVWSNILPALDMFVGLRDYLGFPLIIRGAYRSPDYNPQAGGAPRSQHLWFSALDISSNDVAERGALAEAAAGLWVDNPSDPIGLGIYGTDSRAGRTHLDYGYQRRTWNNADYWIDQV